MNPDLAMQRALDRLHRVGFSALSEGEKTLACIWSFESKVANGGLAHFYKSSAGDLAPYMPAAFRAIGAQTRMEIAERANAVFGPSGVPEDRIRRQEMLSALPKEDLRVFDDLERKYYDTTKELDERLEEFIKRAG